MQRVLISMPKTVTVEPNLSLESLRGTPRWSVIAIQRAVAAFADPLRTWVLVKMVIKLLR